MLLQAQDLEIQEEIEIPFQDQEHLQLLEDIGWTEEMIEIDLQDQDIQEVEIQVEAEEVITEGQPDQEIQVGAEEEIIEGATIEDQEETTEDLQDLTETNQDIPN